MRRNKLMPVDPNNSAVGVQGAPVECSLWTNGIYAGRYEDKYKYTADYGTLRVWGWSSVGTGGKNLGLWDVAGSAEYMPGGPMKRELTSHMGQRFSTPHTEVIMAAAPIRPGRQARSGRKSAARISSIATPSPTR